MLETLNPYLFGMGLSGIPASTGRAPFFGAYQKPAAPEPMGPMMQQAYDLSGVGAMPAAFTSGPYGKVIEPPNPDFLPPGAGGNPPGGNPPGGNPLPTPPTPAGHDAARTSFLTNSLRDYAALASRAGYNGMKAYQEAANVIPGVFQRFVDNNQLPDHFQVPSSGELMKLHQPGVNLSGYALGDDGSPLRHGSTWNDNYFLKHWNPDQPTPNSPPPAVNAPPPGAPTKPPYVPNDYLLPPRVTTGINQMLPQAAGARRRAGISGAQQYLGNLTPQQISALVTGGI